MGLIEVKLAEVLERRGQTFYWLVQEAKVPYSTLRRLDRGVVASIRFDTLAKICEALNCQPGELLSYKATWSESKKRARN